MKKIARNLLIAFCAVVIVAGLAWATGLINYDDQDMNGIWRFWNDVTFKSPNCEVTFEDTVTFEDSAGVVYQPTTLTHVSGTGYTITDPTTGSLYIINTAGSNELATGVVNASAVTTNLPTPTSAMDGWKLTIIHGSGTSDLALYCGGLPVGTSGTTFDNDMDAHGDAMTLVAHYNSAVSWYVESEKIN